ncbi:MAG TPA: hypothetical protein PK224_09250 [Nitrospira sp.]|nr:hypothetical protein [Nitrospira sp.]
MQLAEDLGRAQARRLAVRRIETALGLITTGLAHRDRQIRDAILIELAGTTAHGELLKKLDELLDAIASNVNRLGRRLRDGFAYDTLLELQTEARAIFLRLDGAR